MMKKKTKIYRPKVTDVNDEIKNRTQRLAIKQGFRVEYLQGKIFETGLVVMERQLAQTGE